MTSLLRPSYYIYPKAIDRIETAQHSRKFAVVLYDILGGGTVGGGV